ncbi:hypothetical protein E8E11_001963 [Didymella keratinophila]|nr:hypothetical protein E8E11_001963 [Didymella keratinophila]
MMGIATVDFIISAVTLNLPARFLSCFLFASAVSLSIVNVVSMASFIYTPYLYPKSDGPKYVIAMSSNASFAAASIVAAWVLRTWLMIQNKRLKRNDGNVFYAY